MSFTKASKVHSSIPAGAKAVEGFAVNDYVLAGRKVGASNDAVMDSMNKDLARIGIHVPAQSYKGWAMDAIQPSVTAPSVTTPVQFLQEFLPGFVYVATAARKIDDLVGVLIAGDWKDEEIIQAILEQTGTAVPYGDYTNVPLSSWNNNWNKSTVVRFEQGLQVGQLEQARASAANIDSASQKRIAAMQALEIARNLVGFFGYNNGANNTFGYLNAPGLPAYVAAPVLDWSTATYLEIQSDLLFAFNQLQTQSQDLIDPRETVCTLAISTNRVNYLSTSSDFGNSVRNWLNENYPKCRVESAPQLNEANGGQNVFYLYADKIADASTDGGLTFIQPVPTKFMTLGTQQLAKAYEEDYLNATAGIMCKRPWAVVRITGI